MLGAMVVALIVIGVVVFLVFDAYLVSRVFAGRRSADDYGAIPVPGQTTVALPTGRVKLSYQEGYKASSSGDSIDFDVPAALEVRVVSPAGEALEIKGPGFKGTGSVTDTGKNWSRARVGAVQVTEPGEYTVTAVGELQNAVEPQLLVGK
jgi:hypothetical protein